MHGSIPKYGIWRSASVQYNPSMFNAIDLMAEIREKPGMWIGSPSVWGLYHCTRGIRYLPGVLGVNDRFDVWGEFDEWMNHYRFAEEQSGGECWARILLRLHETADAQWDALWKCWDEFLILRQHIASQRRPDIASVILARRYSGTINTI